jgi:hypothetical protein
MNSHQSLRTSSILAAAFSIFTIVGVASSVEAGQLLGGKVGGMVGGVVGGVTGTVGGLAGSATNSVSEATSSTGAITGTDSGTSTNTLGHNYGTVHSSKALVTVKLKLKSDLLKAKAGVYVLGKHGQLVRISAKVAFDHILHAKAKVYVLSNGNLIRVKTKVALLGIKAKAKVYVLDGHNLLKAKAIIALGGHHGLKAKVGAKAGLGGATVRIGLTLGGSHKPGNGGGNPGGDNGGTTVGGNLGTAVAGLSNGERRELMRKCPAVLMSPADYTSDTVRVCRVLSQLSGL